MVVREIPYTCECCQTKVLVRSGENRRLPGARSCETPQCPSCGGPCNGSARPFSI